MITRSFKHLLLVALIALVLVAGLLFWAIQTWTHTITPHRQTQIASVAPQVMCPPPPYDCW